MLETDPGPDLPPLVVSVGPVLVTLPPPALLQVCQHHDQGDLLLDDHLPEVLKRVGLGGDGGNEFLLDVSKLDRGGINVGDRGFTLTRLLDQLHKVLRYSLTDDFIKSNQVVIVRNYNILFVNYGTE